MKRHPVVRQLQPLAEHASRRGNASEGVWDQLSAIVADPEFIAVAAFSAIGFLIAVNAIIYFPDFGTIVQQMDALR